MNSTLTRTFLDNVLEQLNPDKAYGYWGTNNFQTILNDDENPTWRVDFSIRPDEDTSVMDDGDWFGELAPVTYRHNRYGDPRPAGFDGRARKLYTRHETYWWQPPADVDDTATLSRELLDLMEQGYSVIIVSLKRMCDCCDQWKEVGYETLGGVALIGNYTENLAELRGVVCDLLDMTIGDLEVQP